MAKISTLTSTGKNRKLYVKKYTYDFAVDTGAQGTYEGASTDLIPQGAEIVGLFVHEVTTLTSGGAATIAVDLECGTTDVAILAATAYNSAPFASAGGYVASVANQSNILTADGYFRMTVATADLTAGKINFYISYIY